MGLGERCRLRKRDLSGIRKMKTRKPLKITSRSSSITNAFVQAIIPYRQPREQDVDVALSKLGMSRDTIECIYCGNNSTDWDHLFALVKNKRPSGFFSDIGNMVPACGPCNQSKSGQDWKAWMLGNAKNSPTTRGVTDVAERIRVIEKHIKTSGLRAKNIEDYIDNSELEEYWKSLEEIHSAMSKAQNLASRIQSQLQSRLELEKLL